VVAALNAWGIDSILLKGATTADWLYPGEVRAYSDADLLVTPAQASRAAEVLTRLDFEVGAPDSPHARPWVRALDGARIDLHHTVWGPHRPPEAVWRELRAWVEADRIASTPVHVLNLPARALLIGLHAAQHRHNSVKAREDLRRAALKAPIPVWRQAEHLADRLLAVGELADGLMLEPEGRMVLEQLPLARAVALVNAGGPRRAIVRARVREAQGARRKLAVLATLALRRAPAFVRVGRR
jgi:hypothetical protein